MTRRLRQRMEQRRVAAQGRDAIRSDQQARAAQRVRLESQALASREYMR